MDHKTSFSVSKTDQKLTITFPSLIAGAGFSITSNMDEDELHTCKGNILIPSLPQIYLTVG